MSPSARPQLPRFSRLVQIGTTRSSVCTLQRSNKNAAAKRAFRKLGLLAFCCLGGTSSYRFNSAQHLLYFFPLPQGQGSLRPAWAVFVVRPSRAAPLRAASAGGGLTVRVCSWGITVGLYCQSEKGATSYFGRLTLGADSICLLQSLLQRIATQRKGGAERQAVPPIDCVSPLTKYGVKGGKRFASVWLGCDDQTRYFTCKVIGEPLD